MESLAQRQLIESWYEFATNKEKEINDLKTHIQKLEAALNNHFCLKHQKKFLSPGKHSSYKGDPLTPSGAGCIYCNMIRLEVDIRRLQTACEIAVHRLEGKAKQVFDTLFKQVLERR